MSLEHADVWLIQIWRKWPGCEHKTYVFPFSWESHLLAKAEEQFAHGLARRFAVMIDIVLLTRNILCQWSKQIVAIWSFHCGELITSARRRSCINAIPLNESFHRCGEGERGVPSVEIKSAKQALQQKSVWALYPEGFSLYLSQSHVIEVITAFQFPSIESEVQKVFTESDKEPQECVTINWFSLLTLYHLLLPVVSVTKHLRL